VSEKDWRDRHKAPWLREAKSEFDKIVNSHTKGRVSVTEDERQEFDLSLMSEEREFETYLERRARDKVFEFDQKHRHEEGTRINSELTRYSNLGLDPPKELLAQRDNLQNSPDPSYRKARDYTYNKKLLIDELTEERGLLRDASDDAVRDFESRVRTIGIERDPTDDEESDR
jgi:hypothetical protein